ncbi:MAG TPA: DUF262 and DUF1524 domain-containing protein [Pyrinomonadaceae bacterium]|nr:DUF262 and DUF1524 domain-containing protein [Pyrinomonadaceae bacterium]
MSGLAGFKTQEVHIFSKGDQPVKATETKFLPFLQGIKQFIIPIYQRTYSWNLSQCRQLWDDITRAGADESLSAHFVGSIVYIERGLYQVSAVPQLLVIDGQQRITTVSLLLSAFGKVIEERQAVLDISRKKVSNYYLINPDEEADLHYKLVLTQSDKETLKSIIDDRDPPTVPSIRLKENYRFFLEQLRTPALDLNVVYQGLGKMLVVDISLDRERDNPQLIFESLNSTGLQLSQADLIRNYILMGLETQDQNDLYTRYWFPMEQSFGHAAEHAAPFDRFVRDYLTIKTGTIPNIGDVYSVFKTYVQSQVGLSIHEVLADIYRYSKYFVRLAFHRDKDEEINEVLNDINTLRVDVAYPFLMEVYDDYDNAHLDRSEFLEILKLVESYVFRRVICGVLTNSLNKTFANLMKEINKDAYLESLKAAFSNKESYRRFPTNGEFMREFVVKDVYSLRNRNYLLRKLENNGRKEKIEVESYTIEHIMPQKPLLSAEWQRDLGPVWREIQLKYLHTMGNLTLTGYNAELGDRSFREKQSMKGGFADSPLQLNRGLADLERWDETAIHQRALSLAQHAVEIWAYPALPPAVLERYARVTTGKTYSIEAHAIKSPMLELFEELRKRILNLDSSVREEVLKRYIAYKADTNFVDIVPQKSQLTLIVNLEFHEINDSLGIARDVSNVGRWGNGDVELKVTSFADIDNVMPFIRQSFQSQRDGQEFYDQPL